MPEDKRSKNLKAIPLIIFSVSLMVTGQVLEKMGIRDVQERAGDSFAFATHIWLIVINRYVLIGIVGYGISAFVWLLVLSMADLSFAYPFLAVSYVAIIIVSPLTLPGERWPDFWKVLAIVLIIAGVLCMAQGEKAREKRLRKLRCGQGPVPGEKE
jgi:multidrug transporter EmrE-like cation transporter